MDSVGFVFENAHTKENYQECSRQAGSKHMKNDSISDFLARIKNAYLARHKTLEVSYAKTLDKLGKILEKEGFISQISISKQSDGKKLLTVALAYPKRKPAVTNLERVSKPGLRVYVRKGKTPFVYGGEGIVVISTSKGLMTGKEAVKKNLGGEVICKIW